MQRTTIRRELDGAAPLTKAERADLARLAAAPDSAIDYDEIPPGEPGATATRLRDLRPEWFRPVKQSTTVRIDADVLAWLRAKGRGYQTRLNAILREAMLRDGG
jgi:uncharacterized protein (DUF4415 family)